MRRVRSILVICLLTAVAVAWWLISGDEVAEAAPQATPAPSSTTPDPALEDFVPSEELPTDSAISFPVDI